MEELNTVLNASLSESKQIAQVIAKIEAGGYDVFLVLHARNKPEERAEQPALTKSAVKPGFTPRDIKFLKAMHVSAGE
jgi:hypothetical protein